jgi:hypothetical protein
MNKIMSSGLMAIIFAIPLASCNKSTQSATDTTHSTSNGSINISEVSTKGKLVPFGPQFFSVYSCKNLEDILSGLQNNTSVSISTTYSQQISMTISKPDPIDLDRQIIKDTGPPATIPTPVSTGKKPSKWDFDVNIPEPKVTANGIEYKSGLITIKLDPKPPYNFRFIDKPYTIRAGDFSGLLMFCDADVAGNTATVKVIRVPGVQRGSLNIGLVIEDKGKSHEMPIFFDPEVKNEG